MFSSTNRHKRHAIVDNESLNGKRRCVETLSSPLSPSTKQSDEKKKPNTHGFTRAYHANGISVSENILKASPCILPITTVNTLDPDEIAVNDREKTKATTLIAKPNKVVIHAAVGKDPKSMLSSVSIPCDVTQKKKLKQQRQNHIGMFTVKNNAKNANDTTQCSISLTKTQSKGDLPPSSICNKLEDRVISPTNGENNVEDDASNKTKNIPSQSDNEEDSDYDDKSEESSLLDSWSDESSEDEVIFDSDCKGVGRLKKKLALRKERTKRLSAGRPPAYIRLLEINEEMASEIKIAKYKERHPDEDDHDKSKDDDNEDREEDRLLLSTSAHLLRGKKIWSRVLGLIQFEALHTLPYFYTILIILFGHCTFYGFLEVVTRIVYYTFLKKIMSHNSFSILLTIFGLCLQRLNGSVFRLSSTKNYSLLKMEMSNRQQLGSFDTRIWKKIKGLSVLNSVCNMLGYYSTFIGITHFYYKWYSLWMYWVEIWWTGIWHTAEELINTEFQQQVHQQSVDSCLSGHSVLSPMVAMSPTCEGATQLVSSPILKWLFNGWCNDLTLEYRDLQIVYHGCWLAVAFILAYKIGMNVLTFCD
mmetsp:Transcript_32192/g.36544  ORF Transcript_32192/g.36544 Transcript_32192/m.36544 type:complete len:588 (+) Transcript_32192:96-1859(+)